MTLTLDRDIYSGRIFALAGRNLTPNA